MQALELRRSNTELKQPLLALGLVALRADRPDPEANSLANCLRFKGIYRRLA